MISGATAPGFRLRFHPQMVFLANLCVNRHHRLCGVARYASAQWLDFLDLDQKSAFVNWKRSIWKPPARPSGEI